MSNEAVQVWQVESEEPDAKVNVERRPADFLGTCRPAGPGQLQLEVVSGVPTGDPTVTFVVEGRGAFELVRREGRRSQWGMRRRLVLTLRPLRAPARPPAGGSW